jgi:hypothetical protein
MAREQKIAIVTVHGTGDTADSQEGQKWFQKGSTFTEHLRRKLAAEGLDADIIPLLWSGANSGAEREKGAEKLTAKLKSCARRYHGVHVIGHSHGGNVANEAAVQVKWGRRRKEVIHSVITVGTPFINVKTSWLRALGGLAFFLITWGSVIVYPLVALGMWIEFKGQPNWPLFLSYIIGVGACLLFMMRMSRRGARRILRPRNKARSTQSLLAIWHDNDEAISFLRRIEDVPLEPFPRGSLFRGSDAAAIGWGVIAVLALGLVGPALYAAGLADIFSIDNTASIGRLGDVFVNAAVGLLFAPVAFVVVYALYRLLIGGGAELGARGPLNGWIAGVLRGVALGRDGDQVLYDVSPHSHTFQTEPRVLDGELSQRMQAGANAAAEKLIASYRWSLFTVGADTNQALTKLATDAMTWDSLIHTTYFDQPELADMIAAHIVARAKG